MLLHTIGRTGRPYPTNPWVTRYIFPGGHLPTLSEIPPAIERSGLVVTDIEVLRLHYAYTLKAWRERFIAHWEDAKRLYDERFCRMWECYLAVGSSVSLRGRSRVSGPARPAPRHRAAHLRLHRRAGGRFARGGGV
jgi:cyclopropane-fatty-acyl-phospholipid synthase